MISPVNSIQQRMTLPNQGPRVIRIASFDFPMFRIDSDLLNSTAKWNKDVFNK